MRPYHERDRHGYTVCGVKITSTVQVRQPNGAVTCKRCKKIMRGERREITGR